MLAYYAWDTDEAQLLAKSDVVETLQQLVKSALINTLSPRLGWHCVRW